MKSNAFKSLLLLALTMLIVFNGCKKDDDTPPQLVDISISMDNSTVLILFNEPVYASANKSGNLDAASFLVSITGSVAAFGGSYTVNHVAGATSATLNLRLNGIANGTETLTIQPKSASSIYNASGVAMAADQSKSASLKDSGAMGKWHAKGARVAQALRDQGFDSIYIDLGANNAYVIELFTPSMTKTTLAGTFTQTRSGVPNIWTIILSQTAPFGSTSNGIFQGISGVDSELKFEVVQTNPAIPNLSPPTPAGGFGSTSGGAYGNAYVSTFRKKK